MLYQTLLDSMQLVAISLLVIFFACVVAKTIVSIVCRIIEVKHFKNHLNHIGDKLTKEGGIFSQIVKDIENDMEIKTFVAGEELKAGQLCTVRDGKAFKTRADGMPYPTVKI